MRKRPLVQHLLIGALVCVLLVVAYSGGTLLSPTSSSSGTEFGYVVEGDPLVGLDLDASLYGTETAEERQAIEDCYESAVGVRPDDLSNPTYDELFAWRECAVDLGIESKVMKFEPASEAELKRLADEANARSRELAECLEVLGWTIVHLPNGEDGIESFEVDAEHDIETETRLASDAASCGADAGQFHDHHHDH